MSECAYAMITIQVPLTPDHRPYTETDIAAEAKRWAAILAENSDGHVVAIRAYHEPSGSGEPIEVNLYR